MALIVLQMNTKISVNVELTVKGVHIRHPGCLLFKSISYKWNFCCRKVHHCTIFNVYFLKIKFLFDLDEKIGG